MDGEICCFSPEESSPSFFAVQKRAVSRPDNKRIKREMPATFITWDILSCNRSDVHNKPLLERKQLLEKMVEEESPRLQISPYLRSRGLDLHEQAHQLGFEGIVAKDITSPYEFGRSSFWLKVKIWRYQKVYIGGYAEDGESLLVGVRSDTGEEGPPQALEYRGRVKFSLAKPQKRALFKVLEEIACHDSPFLTPLEEKGVIWVKPRLQCEVRFAENTPQKLFRQGYVVDIG